MLHIPPVVGGWITGTRAIPTVTRSLPRSNPEINLTTDYTLGACHPSCNYVIGAVKFTLNNYAAGLAFNRWHTVGGGNVIWYYDGEPPLDSQGRGSNSNVRQWVDYSFYASGGSVVMRRRLFLGKIDATVSVLSHSIDYRLKAGLFT
jgi:hypothetical protein